MLRLAPVLVALTLASSACAPHVEVTPTRPPPPATAPKPPPVTTEGARPVDVGSWAIATCDPSSLEARAAHAAFADLAHAIKIAKTTDDPAPLRASLAQLIDGPCFALARRELPDDFSFDSTLALKTWWEAGGTAWLEGYLQLPKLGQTKRWTLWAAPDVRRSLTVENAGKAPIAPVLCATGDGPCGVETAGWILRAELFFRDRPGFAYGTDDAKSEEDCAARALAAPGRDAYPTLRTCLERLAPRGATLPLGRFRAPKSGFLIVTGRRGHYDFCDEARAYDLATGAAFVASACSGLAFGKNGMVDTARTESRKRLVLTAGRLPLDALREVALLLVLSPHVRDQVRLSSRWYDAPAAILPLRSRDEPVAPRPPPEGWRTSAQTHLAWSWNDGGVSRANGEFTWPGASAAADDYLAHLVAALEASLEPGCVPSRPPASLGHAGANARVSPLDGSASTLDASLRRLETAIAEMRTIPLCPLRASR